MTDEQAAERRLSTLREFVVRSANVGPQALLDRSAADVLAAFDAAGVDALLLKGPVLAQRLYRPGEQRSYIDIDVLVDPASVDLARSVLAELGYDKRGVDFAGVEDFAGILDAEPWAGPIGCGLDLHWRLPGCGSPPAEAWALLYPGREGIVVAGRSVWALGPDALALHVATHAAQSGPEDVKAMGDLARALDRWPLERWQAAALLASELSATAAFAAGLRLLPAGAARAAELALPPSDALNWEIRHRAARPRGTFHVRALAGAPGWRKRVEIVAHSLLPRPAWIAAQMPWARRSRSALAAAYALHLARAPLWALRAWRFARAARRAGSARDG